MSGVPQILADGAIALAKRKSGHANGDNLVLAASSLGCCLVFMSGAVVNVALAAIGEHESLTPFRLQWILNAEMLPVAALTLLGGAAGDRLGQKRIFITGLALFLVGTLASATTASWPSLVGARALAGFGEAFILPNGLSILGKAFPANSKSRAVGIWSAVAAVACIVGPALAGAIIDHGSWRTIFLLNVPIGFIALGLTVVCVPEETIQQNIPIDIGGAILSVVGLGTLGWALTDLTNGSGISSHAVAALLAAMAAIAMLIAWERHQGERAMLPPALFASRSIIGANLFTILLYGAFTVIFTLVPFVMIRGAHLPTVIAGVAFMPLQLLIIIVSPLAGTVCRYLGRRPPLILGAIMTSVSCLAALRIDEHARYWPDVFTAVLLFSVGMSFTVAPLTTLVLTTVDVDRAGTASGVNSAASRAGSLLAIAMLGGVLHQDGGALVGGFRVAMLAAMAVSILAALAALIIEPGPHVDWVPVD